MMSTTVGYREISGWSRGKRKPSSTSTLGYRRLTFMMLDADVVAVSPASVWRVLKQAGLLSRWKGKSSRKGTGFEQPLEPHQHWHVDVSYINLSGTFYYLCSVLDGCSRFLVHWDLRESMKEADIEMILERAKEKYPDAKPRIISDNGPQFIARDFKEFIRISGMTHVRTSPFYPQSNGKIERWHKSLKRECIRPLTPLTLDDARRLIQIYVDHYNTVRLHSAIGYVTPQDRLAGRQAEIHAARDHKLDFAVLTLLPEPYRTMVVVAQCLGLRVSEILALQWRDIDFGELTMRVSRGVIDGVVDEVKTEYSEDDLPLDPDLATVLLSWKERCPKSEAGWMFPSPITGRCYHASPIQQDYIRPAGRKLGLGDIGWHTFRHTYRSWLDSVGTSMGVQQKLMRHAQIATTMNVYGDAMMESKRAANSKVVQMALRPALKEAK